MNLLERVRIGIDIGGTFTDSVLVHAETGRTEIVKTLSTPGRLHEGVLAGLEQALKAAGATSSDCSIVHGSTVAVNAVIEGKGAKIGAIVTHGFRDVLEIGRQSRTNLYDLNYDKPRPLVPRSLTVEVRERLDAGGAVLEPLNEEDVAKAVELFRERGVRAVAIGFLHSYRNPAHEVAARDIVRRLAPEMAVILSSQTCPEFREYERISTAAVSAYVAPLIENYLGTLEHGLADRGHINELSIMQSNGGIVSSRLVRQRPLDTLFSGPAGGVVMAAFHGAACGFKNLITFDMGGTSCDVSLISSGVPAITFQRAVAGHAVRVPNIDIETIGAGGGSIARVDSDGVVGVGPESAGAVPGPACYGRGGYYATVTDADVVLGIIDPASFLGGSVTLDSNAATEAIDRNVARPIGFDVSKAALGVYQVVNANMAGVVRLVSVERGWDPRDFALVAFGGAAPAHAVDVARLAKIPTVLIPPLPSAGSAWGMLVAPIQQDFVRTCFARAEDVDLAFASSLIGSMIEEAYENLEGLRKDQAPISFEYFADLRYAGQSYELKVPLPSAVIDAAGLAAAIAAFHEEHRRIYGHASADEPVQLVSLRVRASIPVKAFQPPPEPVTPRRPTSARKRSVEFADRGRIDVPVFSRDDLRPGDEISGPAIIEEYGAVTVLPPGSKLDVASSHTLIIATSVEEPIP